MKTEMHYNKLTFYKVTHYPEKFERDLESIYSNNVFELLDSYPNFRHGFKGELELIYNYVYPYSFLQSVHSLFTKNIEIYEKEKSEVKEVALFEFYSGKILACKLVDYVLMKEVKKLND